jgi:3-deoxy-D-manno-octulosonic-acid transferase
LYLVYTVGLAVFFVAGLPVFLVRALRTGKYLPSLRERFGRLPASLRDLPKGPSIWIHAVSVGEVIAARQLGAALREAYPRHRLVLSTTTLAGQAVARKTAAAWDALFYAPFDFPGPVKKALDAAHPDLLVLMETELWPNLIREARARRIRIVVVNGRISVRAFSRYRRIRAFLRPVLALVDLFLMQSEGYADRILAMGAPPEKVRVSGNLKFDATEPRAPTEALGAIFGGAGPLLLAGSTVAGEEEVLLRVFKRVKAEHPSARLAIAPRHPDRFADVPRLVADAGFRCVRRTTLGGPSFGGDEVLLLDTLGELAQVYPFATVAFVGGSLVPSGGHNILEAAVAGRPVIVGPHMENFQEIADLFREGGGLVQVGSEAALGDEILALLKDPARRDALGGRARALVFENQGALRKTISALKELVA